MMWRCAFFFVLLISLDVGQENCGDNPSSSVNEINGCNLKLQEEHDCSFDETPYKLASAAPDDDRTLYLEYSACTIRSQAKDDCTEPQTVVIYGNAVAHVDAMLVQRQAPDNQICFLYDHYDGNAPTQDCRVQCLKIDSNMGQEAVLDTNNVQGLPNYGSAGKNRHVKLLKTGTRSGGGRRALSMALVPVFTAIFVFIGI